MRRWLSGSVSLLSLLLLIATIVLWIRSYSGSDYLFRDTPLPSTLGNQSFKSRGVQFTLGQVRLVWREDTNYFHFKPPAQLPPATWSHGRLGEGHLGWERITGPTYWNLAGFATYTTGFDSSFASSSEQGVAIPLWSLAVLFVLPLIFWWLAFRRQRARDRAGKCPACGYDLRATPERCPECGAAARAPSGRAAV